MSEMVTGRLAECIERVKRLAPLIAEHAAESERRAQLAPAIVEALHESRLFRIMLPPEMGGCGLTLAEVHRVCEEVAAIDGSTGWNMAICTGGPLFGSFIAREAFETIFRDSRGIVAGSLNPMGTTVVPCDGGYRFSGRSTYASGSAQATWLTAAGFALRDGAPQFVDGVPIMRVGMLPVRECKILDTWSVSGLRGTGSNDFVFNDVVVHESFTFEWPEPKATWATGPVAHIPLQTLLAGGFVAVALGIARHAIEFLKELAVAKVPLGSRSSLRERPLAQIHLAQAEGCLQAARAYFYETIAEIWRRGEAGTGFDLQARAYARLAPLTAVRLAAQSVDLVYDAAGITAIQTSSPIERCWRDVHAVTQQIQISSARYETVGRVLFGLDPAGPIL